MSLNCNQTFGIEGSDCSRSSIVGRAGATTFAYYVSNTNHYTHTTTAVVVCSVCSDSYSTLAFTASGVIRVAIGSGDPLQMFVSVTSTQFLIKIMDT